MQQKTIGRRGMLAGGATLAALGALRMPAARAAPRPAQEKPTMDLRYTPPGQGIVTGKGVGDFDFLAGEWLIRHRRLKDGTSDEWQAFESSATVHRVLDGMGSIEELRKPDGSFMGMGVRIWLPQQQRWADHWTSAANGVVNPPQLGQFIDGEGVFVSSETVDGTDWLYRGVWDRITTDSCRWHQSSTANRGTSWTWNWWMEWQRK